MVGVPGRSKGCTTCRRRKIRCDLQEPACRKCTKSGRECEGYARYPVFLNRTPQGPQKRHALEEAKPLPGSYGENSLHDPFKPSKVEGFSDNHFPVIDNRMLFQPNKTALTDQQLVSAFWEKYIPLDASAQDGSACVWLEQVISLPQKSDVLKLSLKALAMTRLGWIEKDRALALQGNMHYGNALQSIQTALWRQDATINDDLFVAGYVLAVHELFESTTASITGWHSHISGLSQLVIARGPHTHKSPIPRATLEELRTATMIQSVLYRTSSFLGNDDWQAIPWIETPKDVYQKLYDKGFAFAAILEDIDKANLWDSAARFPALLRHLRSLSELDSDMDLWYQELLAATPSPMFWSPQSAQASSRYNGWYQDGAQTAGTLPSFEFRTLRLANIIVSYWALRTVLSISITTTCDSALSMDRETQAQYIRMGELRSIAQRLLQNHGPTVRLRLATNIMRSMPYCLNDSMGLLGAQKSLFALRTALATLRHYPGEELRWCHAIYQQMDAKKGLRYASEIAKIGVKGELSGREALSSKTDKTFLEDSSSEYADKAAID